MCCTHRREKGLGYSHLSKRELVVATGQFPVSKDIGGNLSYIVTLMRKAKEKGADVIHFSESSLSGYAGVDFERFEEQNETLLRHALKQIFALAARLKIWVIVGSHYYDGENDLPYNLFMYHL